jgi:uncharacterized membrane protein
MKNHSTEIIFTVVFLIIAAVFVAIGFMGG